MESENPQSNSLLEYRDREFFVCFRDTTKYLWTPFLKKGFHHCFVIERLEFIYLMADPSRVGLNLVLPACTSEHNLISHMMRLDPGLRVLHVMTHGSGSSLTLRPKILNCVSVVQYVMGIGFNFAITPHGLFKRLLKGKHKNILSVGELKLCQQEEAQPNEHKQEQNQQQENLM